MRAYLSSFDKWRNWGQERLKSYLESLLGSGSPRARTRPAWCPHSSVLSLTCLLYAHPKETGSPSLDWSGHLGEVLQPNPDFEVSWFSLKVCLAKKGAFLLPSGPHLFNKSWPPNRHGFFFPVPHILWTKSNFMGNHGILWFGVGDHLVSDKYQYEYWFKLWKNNQLTYIYS